MKNILITGGAGFIGTNSAAYFLNKGYQVTILDNFSRKGGKENVEWLKKSNKAKPKVVVGDIRNFDSKLTKEVGAADFILHLAGQVAVTTSVVDPREDFDINALGTFNVLEAMRKTKSNAPLIYSSTNKVYGGLEDLEVKEEKTRYSFKKLPDGVSEARGLDFHSPYGCSKGAADQYVRDYSRIYGLNTVVFRQSCIYGPRQFGIEDQGWVAWFIIALALNKDITVYGNGKQVRDVLFIDDLVRAYDLAFKNIKKTAGNIYNIGGGPKNTISIWYEFRPILEKLFEREIKVKYSDWRPGDQPIFISDIRKAEKEFSWKPRVGVDEGIKTLFEWINSNKEIFGKFF
jgi:CDP-paratose 2-epimerase